MYHPQMRIESLGCTQKWTQKWTRSTLFHQSLQVFSLKQGTLHKVENSCGLVIIRLKNHCGHAASLTYKHLTLCPISLGLKRMMKLRVYGLSKPIFWYQTHFHPEKMAKIAPIGLCFKATGRVRWCDVGKCFPLGNLGFWWVLWQNLRLCRYLDQ